VSKRTPSLLFYIYGGSVLLHAALAVGAIMLPKSTTKEAVAIELHEAKKKKEPPKPPAPPPPPPAVEKEKPRPAPVQQQAQAKVAPVAKAAEAPPPVPMGADGFADLGVSLGNADGPGIAVPGAAAPAAVAAAPTATATATHKVEQLAVSHKETCTDPVVRPKRKVPVAPKYTLEARQAEIEGVVRVEVQVDETGQVISARVVSGLGYGLDDAALTAAKASTFEPASRCGKPVIGTIVLPFRFQET
jgi:periplasmic protein TonB